MYIVRILQEFFRHHSVHYVSDKMHHAYLYFQFTENGAFGVTGLSAQPHVVTENIHVSVFAIALAQIMGERNVLETI